MERKYYEVEFGHEPFSQETEDCDTYSICIIAEHSPSIEETTEFCKKDMEKLGYEVVRGITDITYEEAHNFFDMENEENFPVLK